MEFEFKGNRLKFDKELSNLDKLVLKFVKVLDAQHVDYVIISGYIAILFGRSRNTEDVDLFVEEMPKEHFILLWNALGEAGFECINAGAAESAYEEYLKDQLAIRFAVLGTIEPNFELKFPKTKYNRYSLKNKLFVELNGEELRTSELELQIAFKLYLGADKDLEDARHLYKVFKEHLNIGLMQAHIQALGVAKQAERILWKDKYQS